MEDMVTTRNLDHKFWQGKRVLITGHTGFKGSWMSIWLAHLGAQVTGVALPPNTEPNLYTVAGVNRFVDSVFCDIRDAKRTSTIIRNTRPEIVFHLAAQPLVRASYRDPLTTYHTNVLGTAQVLDALRDLDSVKVAVIVTTDKVYYPSVTGYPYRETDRLGGHDPYSASKAASELVIESYRSAFLQDQGVAVASARAGNVIGGGDWSEDRLIPDAIRAWQHRIPLKIRHPEAVRPWQHVLEPLSGYLSLAQQLWHTPTLCGAYNFGPTPHEAAAVRDIISLAQTAYGLGQVQFASNEQGPHEAAWLALETALTRRLLGHSPVWSLQQAVQYTMHWYRAHYDGQNARTLCLTDIENFAAAQTHEHD